MKKGLLISLVVVALLVAVIIPVNAVAAVTTTKFTCSPTSFVINALQGENPASQTLRIKGTSSSSIQWTVSDDLSWLTMSPTSGSCSKVRSGTSKVSVNIGGLAVGEYHATITGSGDGATPVLVPVTLNVGTRTVIGPILLGLGGRGVAITSSTYNATGLGLSIITDGATIDDIKLDFSNLAGMFSSISAFIPHVVGVKTYIPWRISVKKQADTATGQLTGCGSAFDGEVQYFDLADVGAIMPELAGNLLVTVMVQPKTGAPYFQMGMIITDMAKLLNLLPSLVVKLNANPDSPMKSFLVTVLKFAQQMQPILKPILIFIGNLLGPMIVLMPPDVFASLQGLIM